MLHKKLKGGKIRLFNEAVLFPSEKKCCDICFLKCKGWEIISVIVAAAFFFFFSLLAAVEKTLYD